MKNLSKVHTLYLQGTLTIIVITIISFFGLNLLPIAYSFRFLEVFGIIMLIILMILGTKTEFINQTNN